MQKMYHAKFPCANAVLSRMNKRSYSVVLGCSANLGLVLGLQPQVILLRQPRAEETICYLSHLWNQCHAGAHERLPRCYSIIGHLHILIIEAS